jgi:creatinine amidohydrolase
MREDRMRSWQALTTGETAEIVERDPVVVLPLAAVEQHGPHLPLSTDVEIGLGILDAALRELGDDFPAWLLPPQAVGASQEHLRFPGTLSLSAPLLIDLIQQLGGSLASAGVRRLVISNSHGGNRPAVDVAALTLRRLHAMLVVKASYFDFPRPPDVVLPDTEWRHGLHAGAVETAMMLHLRPDLVRAVVSGSGRTLGRDLDAALTRVLPEGIAPFAWLADDLAANGVAGDPQLATADMGRRLVAHYGRILADVIRDAQAFPLERLAEGV